MGPTPTLPFRRLPAAVLAGLLASCAEEAPGGGRVPAPRQVAGPQADPAGTPRELQLRSLAPPIDAGRLAQCLHPRVLRGGDGNLYLSWTRRLGSRRHALEFTRFDGAAFAPVRTVAEGDDWFVNWADFPSLVAAGNGSLAAHWLARIGEGRYSYGIRVACSTDGGTSFSAPFWLHDDRAATEHGFATLVPGVGEGAGAFHAVWLDGRDLKTTGAMTLRTRRFGTDGSLGGEILLDDRVCECCATAAGLSGGRLFAVYRDSTGDGVRDISIVHSTSAVSGREVTFSEPVPCADDGWRNPG